MKITTAALVSMLALGSAIAFAQDGNPVSVKVVPADTHTITINAVMKPLVAASVPVKVASPDTHTVTINAVMTPLATRAESASESNEFHVNRSAALNATVQSTIHSRQLQALPLQNGSVLNVLPVR